MAYLIYHTESTRILHVGRNYYSYTYQTQAAAKAALTRAVNAGAAKREGFAIADASEFYSKIEKTETVKNLMSGADVVQGVNTPACCDPCRETYWSM